MRLAGYDFRPRRERVENTAQFIALIRISTSPGAPNFRIEIGVIFPSVTTTSTPMKASRIPEILTQPRPSFNTSQPSNAMNTGVVDTIQAVVLASDVINAFDWSHW